MLLDHFAIEVVLKDFEKSAIVPQNEPRPEDQNPEEISCDKHQISSID